MGRIRLLLAGLGLSLGLFAVATSASGAEIQLNAATSPSIPTTTVAAQGAGLEISTGHEFYRNSPTFDSYRPAGVSEPLTALIMVHGGGWRGSDGEQLVPYAQLAALNGHYAVFSVNYRTDAQDPVAWADELHDVQAAIRAIVANADTYKVRRDGVLLLGDSAGGNLTALISSVGTANPVKGEPAGGARDLAVPILGVVAWSPPTELAALVPVNGAAPAACTGDAACDFGWNSPAVVDYIGCPPSACPQSYAQASPITWVSAHTAPTYISGGTNELVPLSQISSYADKLHATGVATTSVVIESQLHATQLGPWLWPSTMTFLAAHTPAGPKTATSPLLAPWIIGVIVFLGALIGTVADVVLRRRRRARAAAGSGREEARLP